MKTGIAFVAPVVKLGAAGADGYVRILERLTLDTLAVLPKVYSPPRKPLDTDRCAGLQRPSTSTAMLVVDSE